MNNNNLQNQLNIDQKTIINNNNDNLINKWSSFKYTLPNNILSLDNIRLALIEFNKKILANLKNHQYILIIFKVKTSDNLFRNISSLQRINKFDMGSLLESFIEYWNIKDQNYKQMSLSEIHFFFKIVDDDFKVKSSKINFPDTNIDKPNLLKFGTFNFPSTMDLYQWGYVEFINGDQEAIVYKKHSNAHYFIKFNKNIMNVDYINNSKTLVSFQDELLDINNLGTFKRVINNQILYFINGELDYKIKNFNFKMIKKLSPKGYFNNKIITLDIETYNDNGKLIPYAISYYDGNITKSFYITDYLNHKDMMKACILSLMIRKYHTYKIFIHNFSCFDVIFLFNILMELSNNVKPIINDGSFINIIFNFNNNKYRLYFRDSYLMLTSSLRKLAKSFNVEEKSIFPYNFVNKENIFNDYKGDVPSFNYFSDITLEQYKEYYLSFHPTSSYGQGMVDFNNKQWNLRDETIKYCEQDCVTLYQVLEVFFKNNFENTRVIGSNSPSLPSLAFTNFRTHFLSDNISIPNLNGEVFHYIKKGYSGGAVDVYIPYGRNIHRYDVNSLYPSVMRNNPMPIGNPSLIEGRESLIYDILYDKSKFSFNEVDVYCPDNLNAPLLLTKWNNNGVTKTIAPTGNWKGIYTSIEILRAMEMGYKFNLHKSIYFNSEIIFKDYVDFYYDLKKNSENLSANYAISKLMLNSLYGRFGMSPYLNKHEILSNEDVIKLTNNNEVTDIVNLDNLKNLVSYIDKDNEEPNSLSSVAIAAAITSGARVFMSYFKNMDGYKLYYSDTDSFDIDKPLPEHFVGNELGQVKLEHIFDEAVYLSPKMYGGRTSSYEYNKVKGLKNSVSFDELKSLLRKGASLLKHNEKWYRSLSQGHILIRDELYSLSVSENKRQLIYNTSPNGVNEFINTKPIKL